MGILGKILGTILGGMLTYWISAILFTVLNVPNLQTLTVFGWIIGLYIGFKYIGPRIPL